MQKISNVLATAILILMLLSIITPATEAVGSSTSTSSGMHKRVDVFGGSFSTQEAVVASGETFDVTFSFSPIMDIPDVTLSLVLPADLITLVSGAQEWTSDLKKDEPLTLTLTFIANGDVDAYVKADVKASPNNQYHKYSYYLHVVTLNIVDKNNVSPHSTFGFLRSVNPADISFVPNVESSRAPQNSPAPQSIGGTFQIKGRFTYLNEVGGYSPARYMEVRVRDDNDATWSVIGWTNGTGYFDLVLANSAVGRSPILDLIAEGNWDWKGTDSNGAQYWWSTGVLASNVADGWVWTNYGISPGNNNDILQAGDAVYAETQMIYDWTGWMRSKVTIRWPQETWPHSNGDYIDLPLKSTAGWDHIVVQHEEAHCVMWALYGSWPSGSGPSPHYLWSESSQGFAIVEGWAEFMECAVDNTPNNCVGYYNGHGGNMETNDWFNCQTNGNMDGVVVEGSAASILWDIYDSVNIAGDNDHIAWGFDEIFTVLQNDKPQNMFDFWNDWAARWPDNSTSKGPISDIYYHYGIDEDWFNPWGSVTINGGATYANSRTFTLTINGDDWGAGVKYMRFSENYGVTWGGWYNYAPTFTYNINSTGDGWKYIDVQFADYWWLSGAGTIYDGIGLDTTPPTGTILVANGSAYTTSRTVTLNLTATDNYSGVHFMRFSENMGAWGSWVQFATTYTYTLTSANDGTKSVDVQFQDYAGQNSTMWANWDYIFLDTTKPTGTALINNESIATTSTSVYLNLTYTDTGSGVSKIRFGNTGDPWSTWETPSPTKAWTIPSGDGNKMVWCQVIDNAGLISDQFYDGIILDTAAPTGSIIINGGAATTTTTSVTLTLTYTDSGSGVYQVRYGNSGQPWSAWEAPSVTKAWTLTSGAGLKTVYYQIKDNAGLTSIYSDDITLTSTFGLKGLTSWSWTSNTIINSVASGDVDNDGFKEIVTGGYYFDGTRTIAQLIVWNGSNLAVDRLTTWYWTGNTTINSVAIGDVDGDGQVEIVTGGYYNDGVRNIAQLIEWNGANLAVDRLTGWYWTSNTVINSIALGDVDGDSQVEIVTGGYYNDGSRNIAQLIEWNGANLAVDRLATWYWTGNTVINSVALGDVDNDMVIEVVTGGYYNDGVRNIAQLVEWNGANLAVDRLTTWYWTGNTVINSVAIGDVDGDGQTEVVTGGYFNDGTRNNAQLVEWVGSSLAVDRLTGWYWTGNTAVNSVGIGDVDGDGQTEVVTGGYFNDGTRNNAQLIIWSGSSLAVENIKTWYWTGNTTINSVTVGDVIGDSLKEIVAGGAFFDGTRLNSQLTVWGMI